MIHLVCLTKPYNDNDFKLWYKWHKALGIDKIHVFNNDSDLRIDRYVNPPDTYQYIHGWPDQWNLYNKILNENTLGFENQDIVMFLDDDEFLECERVSLDRMLEMIDEGLLPDAKTQIAALRVKNILDKERK